MAKFMQQIGSVVFALLCVVCTKVSEVQQKGHQVLMEV